MVMGVGVDIMRSNSGRDESRNNLRDPTIRDHSTKRDRTSPSRKLKAPADHRDGRKD
jgi:hypothetical protein